MQQPDHLINPPDRILVQPGRVGRAAGHHIADNGHPLLYRIMDEHQPWDHERAVRQINTGVGIRDIFNKADHVIAQESHCPAVKPWQARGGARTERRKQIAQFAQGVDRFFPVRCFTDARVGHRYRIPPARQGYQRIDPDEGVAAPFLSALHAFEKERMLAAAADLRINGQRRIQVGNYGAVYRNQTGLSGQSDK